MEAWCRPARPYAINLLRSYGASREACDHSLRDQCSIGRLRILTDLVVSQIVSEMLETISEEMSEPTGEAESSLTKADSFAEDRSSPEMSPELPSDHERCIQVSCLTSLHAALSIALPYNEPPCSSVRAIKSEENDIALSFLRKTRQCV